MKPLRSLLVDDDEDLGADEGPTQDLHRMQRHHVLAVLRETKGNEADHIMGYLVKPIKQAVLGPVVGLAMRRFKQFQELRRQAADLRQAQEDR